LTVNRSASAKDEDAATARRAAVRRVFFMALCLIAILTIITIAAAMPCPPEEDTD
jgi:hypothetical protein